MNGNPRPARPGACLSSSPGLTSPCPFVPFVPSRVMTYREHTAWVVKAYLQKHPEGNIMSVRYRGCSPGAACHAHSLISPPNSGPAVPV